MYGRIPVYTMGRRQYTATDNVKIRKAPSVKGKEVKFIDQGYTGDGMDYVPKGVELRVIARSRRKQRVGRWYNYWYLVDVGMVTRVWMFGEFVKPIVR